MGLITPFRYVEIEHAGTFTVIPSRDIFHYRFNDNAASFVSSDTVLNKIWDLCKHSIKATTVTGLYIDGDRERIPYEADALINQLSHYAVDTVYEVARNTIDHLMMHPTWPTEWHLQMHQVIWNDYMYTGNTQLIKKYYDLLKTKTLISLAKKGNLITTVGSNQNKSLLDSLHYVTFDQKPVLRDITDWPQRGNNLAGPDYKGEADEFVFCEYNSIVNDSGDKVRVPVVAVVAANNFNIQFNLITNIISQRTALFTKHSILLNTSLRTFIASRKRSNNSKVIVAISCFLVSDSEHSLLKLAQRLASDNLE
jgi:hypothetical protein